VILLDSACQYSLVGSTIITFGFSRTPHLSDDVKIAILNEAQRQGYNTGKLIWVKQE